MSSLKEYINNQNEPNNHKDKVLTWSRDLTESKKTKSSHPEDSVFGPQRLSLFGEKSERGRLGCVMGSSGRSKIVYN